ncbi:MAG: hypothetical protein FWC03_04055 [Treponema sp.]|nr:hypothetical protein [Treponema sp.]
MGDAQIQPTYPKGLDFEQVWAALMENREQLKETAKRQEETAKRQEETARQIEETDHHIKETDRQIKDINKRFGEYSNRLGEIAEYMVAPNLREKFSELEYNFQKTSKNTEVSDHQNNIFFEIDYFLENYSKAMLVEVKTKLISDHVNAHIARLEKMRKYADLHGDKRSFLGAVAGVVIPDETRKLALNNGLFVIEPSGETFKITSPDGNPREW